MLALVLVMMQKVSEPGLIANFFRVLGVPLDATSGNSERATSPTSDIEGSRLNDFDPSQYALSRGQKANDSNLTATSPASNPPASDSPASNSPVSNSPASDHVAPGSLDHWQVTMRQVFEEIVGELGDTELQQLAEVLFRSESIEPRLIETIDASWESIKDRAKRQFASTADGKEPNAVEPNAKELWQESFRRLESSWQGFLGNLQVGGAAKWSGDQQQMLHSFEQAMDDSLITRLTDGAPWRKSEFIAFVRQLQRTDGQSPTMPEGPLVTGRELDKSTAALRGTFVTLRGRIHRIDQERLVGKDAARQDYFVLWLQSEDNHPQPIAVYATRVSSGIQEAVDRGQRPEVEIHALVSKRIPYGAASGLEIAPTLFARRISALAPVAATGPSKTKPTLRRNDALYAGAMAVVLAAIILIPLLWSRPRSRRRRIAPLAFFLLATNMCGELWAQQLVPPWAKESTKQSLEAEAKEQIREQIAAAFQRRQLEAGELEIGSDGAIDSSILRLLQLLGRVEESGGIEQLFAQSLEQDGLIIQRSSSVGKVVGVQVVPISSEQKSWYQPGEFVYQVACNEDVAEPGENSEKPASYNAVAWSIPSLWLTSKDVSQPVEWDSLTWFDQASGQRLFQVITRIRWKIPQAVSATDLKPPLPENLYRLGRAGWDLANYDHARRENKQGLSRSEAPGLYALLQIAPQLLPLSADEVVDPVDFIASNNRSVELCKLVRWKCRVVQGRVVDVSSSDIAAKSGLTNGYVELDGFVHIGRARFEHPVSPTSDETVDFAEEYPVTILVSPNALQHSDALPDQIVPTVVRNWLSSNVVVPEPVSSWEVGEYLEVAGVAYRMWSYDSEYLQTELADRLQETAPTAPRGPSRQLAPLVIAGGLTLTTPPARRGVDSPASWLSYLLCLGILVVLASIIFYASHDLRRRKRIRNLGTRNR